MPKRPPHLPEPEPTVITPRLVDFPLDVQPPRPPRLMAGSAILAWVLCACLLVGFAVAWLAAYAPLQAHLAASRLQVRELGASVASLNAALGRTQAQKDALAAEVQSLRLTVQTQAKNLSAQAEAQAAPNLEILMRSALSQEIDANDAVVLSQDHKLSVEWVDAALFADKDNKLTPRGVSMVQKLCAVVSHAPGVKLVISAVTDAAPVYHSKHQSRPTPFEQQGAHVVKIGQALQATCSLPASRSEVVATPRFVPGQLRQLPAARRHNRRIEIKVLPAAANPF